MYAAEWKMRIECSFSIYDPLHTKDQRVSAVADLTLKISAKCYLKAWYAIISCFDTFTCILERLFHRTFSNDKNDKNCIQVNSFNIAWKIIIFTSKTFFRLIPLRKEFRFSNRCINLSPHQNFDILQFFSRPNTKKIWFR